MPAPTLAAPPPLPNLANGQEFRDRIGPWRLYEADLHSFFGTLAAYLDTGDFGPIYEETITADGIARVFAGDYVEITGTATLTFSSVSQLSGTFLFPITLGAVEFVSANANNPFVLTPAIRELGELLCTSATTTQVTVTQLRQDGETDFDPADTMSVQMTVKGRMTA